MNGESLQIVGHLAGHRRPTVASIKMTRSRDAERVASHPNPAHGGEPGQTGPVEMEQGAAGGQVQQPVQAIRARASRTRRVPATRGGVALELTALRRHAVASIPRPLSAAGQASGISPR